MTNQQSWAEKTIDHLIDTLRTMADKEIENAGPLGHSFNKSPAQLTALGRAEAYTKLLNQLIAARDIGRLVERDRIDQG